MSNNNQNLTPYERILKINGGQTQPDHYTLLGISIFESDTKIIDKALKSRLLLINMLAEHPQKLEQYAKFLPQLKNEITEAGNCLLDPQRKAQYDRMLIDKQNSETENSTDTDSLSESENNTKPFDFSMLTPTPKGDTSDKAGKPSNSSTSQTEKAWSSKPQSISGSQEHRGANNAASSTDLSSVNLEQSSVSKSVNSSTSQLNKSRSDSSLSFTGLPENNGVGSTASSSILSGVNFDRSSTGSKSVAASTRSSTNNKGGESRIDRSKISGKQKNGTDKKTNRGTDGNNKFQFPSPMLCCELGVLTAIFLVIAMIVFNSTNLPTEQKQAQVHFAQAQKFLKENENVKAFEEIQMAISLYPQDEYTQLKEEIIQKLKPGETMTKTIDDIQYDFCWCPSGSFMMGSPETEQGRSSNETQHKVKLTQGFWMLDSEVTVGMFRSFVKATGYQSHGDTQWGRDRNALSDWSRTWESPGTKQVDNMPVCCVSWFDATAFCKWLGEQLDMDCYLPTEAQWEYACRAGSENSFAGTGRLEDMAVKSQSNANYNGDNRPVKQKKPNAWGLYDMHGNVWEWCADWSVEEARYAESHQEDPVREEYVTFTQRIRRGGSWVDNDSDCRCAKRISSVPRLRAGDNGFRVRLTPDKPKPEQITTPLLTENQEWSYVFVNPGRNWTQRFPLPDSKKAKAGFDTDHLWEKDKPSIWMTTELNLPDSYKPQPLVIQFRVDDDIQVYVNNIRLIRRGHDQTGNWRFALPSVNPLHAGKNIVAVSCENSGGGSGYVNVELYHGGIYPHADLSDKTNWNHYFLVGDCDKMRCVETKSTIYDSITLEGDSNKAGTQGERIMSFTADGKRMCRADKDSVVRLWDVQSGEIIRDFGPQSGIVAAISPDGKQIVSAIEDQVYILDPESGMKTSFWKMPGTSGNYMAISNDGKKVAIDCKQNEEWDSCVYEIQSHNLIAELGVHAQLKFSPDDSLLGGTNGVWNVSTRKKLYENGNTTYSFTWSPRGDVAAFGTHGSEVFLREAKTGNLKEQFKVPGSYIWSLSFSSDGKYLAATTWNTTSIWNVNTGEMVETVGNFGRVAFIPQRDPEQVQRGLKIRATASENKPVFKTTDFAKIGSALPVEQESSYAVDESNEDVAPVPESPQEIQDIPPGKQAGERMVKTINGVQFAFRWCPAGTFMMGSPEGSWGRQVNETQHEVTLTKGFWMLETEVTQKMYKSFVDNNPSEFKGDDLPVESLSWVDCTNFCGLLEKNGLSVTLPTEAQWEYACRAGTQTLFYFGDSESNLYKFANSNRNDGFDKTAPVRSFPPNPWGLYDMHGNIWEMCSDWKGYYENGPVTDPKGSNQSTRHVSRGGGWESCPGCRCADRGNNLYPTCCNELGFRIILNYTEDANSSDSETDAVQSGVGSTTDSNKAVDLIPTGNQAGERMVKTIKGVQFAFRWCPAGSFTMGSRESEQGRFSNETQHRVNLTQGFWIMETEVTQLQWYIIMGKIPCLRKGKTLPVENVSWKDCKEFCEQCETFDLPLKLPTETQWEYACRAGTTSACSGDLNEMAWYENNSYDKSHPVGSKKPNNWGIYDMHGNVWEWCKDWKSAYPKEFVTDPVGPNSGNVRIVRGGSWNDAAQSCRSARRGDNEPIHKSNNLGFRCVLVLPENDLSQSENKTENEYKTDNEYISSPANNY